MPKSLSSTPAAIKARAARAIKKEEEHNKLREFSRKVREIKKVELAKGVTYNLERESKGMLFMEEGVINLSRSLDNHNDLLSKGAVYIGVGKTWDDRTGIFYIKPAIKKGQWISYTGNPFYVGGAYEYTGEDTKAAILGVSVIGNDLILEETPILKVENLSVSQNKYYTTFGSISIEIDELHGGC